MINPLSASQIYTQSLDTKTSRVEKENKANKVENSKVDEIKAQISKGEYKLDMKATASSVYDAIF